MAASRSHSKWKRLKRTIVADLATQLILSTLTSIDFGGGEQIAYLGKPQVQVDHKQLRGERRLNINKYYTSLS